MHIVAHFLLGTAVGAERCPEFSIKCRG